MKFPIAIALALSPMFSAQASVGVVFGEITCADWIAAPTNVKGAWAMGYLSGLNNMYMFQPNSKKDPLGDIKNGNEIFEDVSKRCRGNPNADVSDAVTSIYLELMAKANKK